MDLTTRCPQCGSTFQARLDELQLRKGYIRCIHCAHIFDGYEAVVPSPGARIGDTAATSAAPAPPDEVPRVVRQRTAHEAGATAGHTEEPARTFTVSGQDSPSSAGRDDPVFSIRPSAVRPGHDEGRAEPVVAPMAGSAPHLIRTRPDPVFSAGTGARAPDEREPRLSASGPAHARPGTVYIEPRRVSHADSSQPLPEFLEERHTRRSAVARVFWGVLILIGLVGILAQILYVYRVSIASNVPALRPVLELACAPLDCQVPYPRRIELISIMNSSLQAVPVTLGKEAAKNESRMRLQVTLRNNFEKPQQWPTLTLDLVDFSGAVVAKKILYPKDYLSAEALAEPFAAKSEMRISVPVTVTGFKINGYQLGKFFP